MLCSHSAMCRGECQQQDTERMARKHAGVRGMARFSIARWSWLPLKDITEKSPSASLLSSRGSTLPHPPQWIGRATAIGSSTTDDRNTWRRDTLNMPTPLHMSPVEGERKAGDRCAPTHGTHGRGLAEITSSANNLAQQINARPGKSPSSPLSGDTEKSKMGPPE